LVLLTRHYAGAPESGNDARVYVAPSEPIPVKKWDYAREDLVTRTFDLGVRDGARRADEVARFLEPAPLAATG
jgi:hypothetical protein